jgi:hypothetical protein
MLSFSGFVTLRDWTTWISCSPSSNGIRYSLDPLTAQALSTSFYGLPDTPTHSRILNHPYPTPSPTNRSHGSATPRSPTTRRRSLSPSIHHNIIRIPPPNWNKTANLSNLTTISTKFNPTLAGNTEMKVRKSSAEHRFTYTQTQRKHAESAYVAIDLPDFTTRVCTSYSPRIWFLIRCYSSKRNFRKEKERITRNIYAYPVIF